MVFVLDQLANAVDLYPKDEFAKHMASNTNYDEKSFEKLYDAYFKMKAMDRFHMATDINKSKKFLRKFGIKEEVQSINEGLWTGLKRRGDSKGINGKKGIWAEWGSGTSFQQILWRISPKKGFLDKDALDKDGKPEMDSYWTGWPGPGEVGLLRFFQHNEWEGLDIEKDFPYDDVNKMRMAYDKPPVKTKVQMAHGDHKLAMRFLAKFGIKP
jgi:hypothetical protein